MSAKAKISSVISTTFVSFYNCTYGYSFLKHIEFLKSQGITDILWIQDDEFCIHNNFDDIKDIFEFYKQRDDIKCINLTLPKCTLDKDGTVITTDDVGEDINSNVKIYKTRR